MARIGKPAVGNWASNAWHLIERAVSARVVQPMRRVRLKNKHEMFTHRTRHGLVFNIDPGDFICREIYLRGLYEGDFLEWLVPAVKKPGACLDIGANIGNHSLFLARKFSPVYAFEPNPKAYRQLEDNIRANPGLDVRSFQLALSDTSGESQFFDVRSGHLGSSGFAENLAHLDNHGLDIRKIRLPHVIGDEIMEREGIAGVALVKIDVEGDEKRVIRGLARSVRREKPVIVFEWHGQFRPCSELDEIRELLTGYSLFELEWLHPPRNHFPLRRIMHRIRAGYGSRLVPVSEPEARSYDNILAIHDMDRALFGLI